MPLRKDWLYVPLRSWCGLRHPVRPDGAGGSGHGGRARERGIRVSPRGHGHSAARRHPSRGRLGARASARLDWCAAGNDPGGAGAGRGTCGRGRGDRHRFHGLYPPAGESGRHPPLFPAGIHEPASCLPEALETSRRPTLCQSSQCRRRRERRALARQLRRKNLLGVGRPQDVAGTGGRRGGLQRRRPVHRGGGLDRVAAVRERDPQRLHGGV